MTQFTLHFLGRFQITIGGKPITDFHSDKARALLAYIALDPREHTRQMLATLLWPEIGDQYARTNLRNTLYRLRQTLDAAQPGTGNQLLMVTRQTVQLNQAEANIDVHQFQKLVEVANRTTDPEQLANVITLYQGELLAGFSVADAPPFEEWLLLWREMLHRQALFTLQALSNAYESSGNVNRAYVVANQLLTLDRYREETNRQIMRLLARMGQPDQALQHLEQLRQLLQEEIGVDPADETLTLAQQIAAGEFDSKSERQDRKMMAYSPRPVTASSNHPIKRSIDLHEVPDPGPFYGRASERQQIMQWLWHDRTRVVAIVGIGGIGKTTLAAQSVREIAGENDPSHIDAIFWRSLVNAPPLDELLPPILQTLAGQQRRVDLAPQHDIGSTEYNTTVPANLDDQLRLLLDYLRNGRVLLVLDNMESILDADEAGAFRVGYEAYEQLIQQLATYEHQSHLLLTSRELPRGYALLEKERQRVRSMQLVGLDDKAGHDALQHWGLRGKGNEEALLIERYSGNPLALKLVADTVDEIFGGDITEFLAEESLVFDDIRAVLDQQFARLSRLEQELLYWLAVEREEIPAPMLRQNLLQRPPQATFVEALRSLQRRSLLEKRAYGFALQNVVTEYLTDRLVAEVSQEIIVGNINRLHRHALLKAQTTEYIRESQTRLILLPIAKRLGSELGQSGIPVAVQNMLEQLRQPQSSTRSYAGGNLLNLLLAMGIDITSYDFSHTSVWHASLQNVLLPAVNFTEVDFTHSVFTDTFDDIFSVAFSTDGELFAATTREGNIHIWHTNDYRPERIIEGNGGTIWSIAFSPESPLAPEVDPPVAVGSSPLDTNGIFEQAGRESVVLPREVQQQDTSQRILASGGQDHKIWLWNVQSGQITGVLQGHNGVIHHLAYSPDGKYLASASADQTVRLWDVASGQTTMTLQRHTGVVYAVAFSPDGEFLASASADQHVRLWHLASGEMRHVLPGHATWARTIAFSPNGQLLACAGADHTIYLWNVSTFGSNKVEPALILRGHTDIVLSLAFSPDGQTLATSSADTTIRLWNPRSGELQYTLQSHTAPIYGIAFSPIAESPLPARKALGRGERHLLASGGVDKTVRLWDVDAFGAQIHYILHGFTNEIRDLAFSADGTRLVSGSQDQIIRIWDVATGQVKHLLRGHKSVVMSVAFSGNAQTLASGSRDGTARLWNLTSGADDTTTLGLGAGQMRSIPLAHHDKLWAVAFSPDDQLLATACDDQIVRLWDVRAAAGRSQVRQSLVGHSGWIRAVAFSPDGKTLASGSSDQTICLWDVSAVLKAAIATELPEDGTEPPLDNTGFRRNNITGINTGVSSNGYNATSRHAAVEFRRKTLRGHEGFVFSVAFHPDGQTLASGGADKTIRLWDLSNGHAPAGIAQDRIEQGYLGNGQVVPEREPSANAHPHQILHGHDNWVWSVRYSPDGQLLASGSADRTIRLWDATSGQLQHILAGHTHWVWAVAFSPDSRLLASSSSDETIRLWDVKTGTCLHVWHISGPYDGTNITGATGLTDAQRAALKALGAVEM